MSNHGKSPDHESEQAAVRAGGGADGADSPAGDATASTSQPPSDPLEAVRAERDRLKDQLLRTAADYDNFRKRTRRDLEEAERRGKEETLRELLPVFDNLERALAASETAKDVASVAEGVGMVLKQFEETAVRLGLERVKTVGERFDPNVHDAIQQMESRDVAPGTILAEVVPGYRLDTRLVRPAMVVVARAPSNPSD